MTLPRAIPCQSPWPARNAELREYWGTNMNAAEIAAKMEMTKNAIVSRAYKLKLPPKKRIFPTVVDSPVRTFHAETADLTGLRIGTRTVTHRLSSSGFSPRAVWSVRCDCGRENSVSAKALIQKNPPVACRSCAQISMRDRIGRVHVRVAAPVAPAPRVRAHDDPPEWVPPSRQGFVTGHVVRSMTCEWITSTDKPVTKCAEPVVPGKPYCADHGMACVITRVGNQRVRGYAPSDSQ